MSFATFIVELPREVGMRKQPAPRLFREGDRVGPSYYGEKSDARGTFMMYCPGYLSHAVVRWDGAAMPSRIAVSKLRLVERPCEP